MQKSKSVTDRPTDQQTNRPTDRVTYRVACTRLKRGRGEGVGHVTDVREPLSAHQFQIPFKIYGLMTVSLVAAVPLVHHHNAHAEET